MILASTADSRWNTIFHNTAGIVFLATPHHGSHLANAASRTFGHIPGLSRLLPFLEAHSSYLTEVAGQFNSLWGTRRLFSFRETMKTYGLMVVPQKNARTHCLEETVYDIPCDHIDIAKPESINDHLFKQIISAILFLLLHKASYGPTEPAKRAIEQGHSISNSIQKGAFGVRQGDSVWTSLEMPVVPGVPTWFYTLGQGGHH